MSVQTFLNGRVTLHAGDCLAVLPTLDENSVDSVVCDPPYGLQFMGREWDRLWRGQLTSRARKLPDYSATNPQQMQKWHEAWAHETLRVLKPGGHLIAFGGTRTYHRLACAIEDAGFEIRDAIMWHYGSGFPKSHDVSKGIDRAAGVERTVGGISDNSRPAQKRSARGFDAALGTVALGGIELTAPATDSARQWEGWGTALKPATEILVLARKPLSEKTVAANVLRWGTGAINVDACRVAADENLNGGAYAQETMPRGEQISFAGGELRNGIGAFKQPLGRWPANLLHDGSDEVVEAFPETTSGAWDGNRNTAKFSGIYNPLQGGRENGKEGDSGSAARFFYAAKADSDDRLGSKHPTVKPLDLCCYLVRLVTPKGGTVLDPFAGTGTTGEAAFREGMSAVLIEREEEYLADITRRMKLALAGPDERRHTSLKARGKVDDAGPLFASEAL